MRRRSVGVLFSCAMAIVTGAAPAGPQSLSSEVRVEVDKVFAAVVLAARLKPADPAAAPDGQPGVSVAPA